MARPISDTTSRLRTRRLRVHPPGNIARRRGDRRRGIANDPRAHLDVKSPGDGSNDPSNKTALFLSPFESGRYYAPAIFDWLGTPAGYLKQVNGFNWSSGIIETLESAISSMQ